MSWSGVKKQTNIENIKAWCDEMGIENYTVNSQGEIDVDGNVDLGGEKFKELPYKFGKVGGYFSIRECKNLTSLKNCPDCVEGWFNCSFCKNLNSIKGCTLEVHGDFYCIDCPKIVQTQKDIIFLYKLAQAL